MGTHWHRCQGAWYRPSPSQGLKVDVPLWHVPIPLPGNWQQARSNMELESASSGAAGELVPRASFARACDSACQFLGAAIGRSLWVLRVMSLGTCAIPSLPALAAALQLPAFRQSSGAHTLQHSTRFEVQTPSCYAVTSG